MQIDKNAAHFEGVMSAHPDTPASAIDHVSYSLSFASPHCWRIRYEVGCSPEKLKLPALVTPARTDGLWKTTCAELFLLDEETGGYFEYNFAPSGAWAAYSFSSYRDGMAVFDTSPPEIATAAADDGSARYKMTASLESDGPQGSGPWHIGLSMVIEEVCGTKSYWALRHPPGKPDFHHKHCFALQLPSPERA